MIYVRIARGRLIINHREGGFQGGFKNCGRQKNSGSEYGRIACDRLINYREGGLEGSFKNFGR